MKSFDEFWDKVAIGLNADENEEESIYEAGAQSRQSEVDELKLKINEVLKMCEDWHKSTQSALAVKVINTIKGENHES